jgi:hypothetical protein
MHHHGDVVSISFGHTFPAEANALAANAAVTIGRADRWAGVRGVDALPFIFKKEAVDINRT